ncbi:ATP-binding cassette domain-containing protein [Candidatus Micrarchaeota archaeon]|nr:ATP-binding cassette domain-containing protein [Candidatus Micrarchaeota archaeon]
MKKEVLKLKDIEKVYHMGEGIEVRALRGVNLTINESDFITILGPSGSGKSTLLHILGLLDSPTSGKRYIDGKDTSGFSPDEEARIRGNKIGFIFQTFNLIPSLTALENVMLPLMLCQQHCKDRRGKAKELLERVGLGERLDHRPSQLSGGQRQRVAIARALVNEPEVILADEPTGNLDSKTGHDVLDVLEELHNEGTTIVIITHDEYIAKVTDKMVRLMDGKIVDGKNHKVLV